MTNPLSGNPNDPCPEDQANALVQEQLDTAAHTLNVTVKRQLVVAGYHIDQQTGGNPSVQAAVNQAFADFNNAMEVILGNQVTGYGWNTGGGGTN